MIQVEPATLVLNFASQAAIERLGAQKDRTLRHVGRRRDGTVRDAVMHSTRRAEWPPAKDRLSAHSNDA